MPKSKKTKAAARSVPIVRLGASDLRSRFTLKTSPDGMSVRIRGREMLSRLTASATTVYGDNLLDYFVSPTTLPGRAARIASTYERFKFHAIHLDYTPTVPATEPGAFVAAYDVDINDIAPTGPSAVSRLLTNQSATLRRVCAPFSYPLKMDLTMPYMYVSPTDSSAEPRTEYQGHVIFNWAGESLDEEKVFGHLFIDYDLELRNPQVEDLGLSGIYPSSHGSDPVLGPAYSTKANSSGARIAAVLTRTLEKSLSGTTQATWLTDADTKSGGSYPIPLTSRPGWNERFIEIAVGKVLNILVAYTIKKVLQRIPAVPATAKTAAVPETREFGALCLISEAYGTSSKDSYFKGSTGVNLGQTDYGALMYAKNGPRMIVNGDPAAVHQTRFADSVDFCTVAGTNFGGYGKMVMSSDTPTLQFRYAVGDPISDLAPCESDESVVVSGTTIRSDPVTTAHVAYWLSIRNDTDRPAYLTTYAAANSYASIDAYTAGGMYPFEATLEGTAYPPCVTVMPDKPDFLETVNLSETPALLASLQTGWPPWPTGDEVAASAAAVDTAPPAVAEGSDEHPFRVPRLDPMPNGRLGKGGH